MYTNRDCIMIRNLKTLILDEAKPNYVCLYILYQLYWKIHIRKYV